MPITLSPPKSVFTAEISDDTATKEANYPIYTTRFESMALTLQNEPKNLHRTTQQRYMAYPSFSELLRTVSHEPLRHPLSKTPFTQLGYRIIPVRSLHKSARISTVFAGSETRS